MIKKNSWEKNAWYWNRKCNQHFFLYALLMLGSILDRKLGDWPLNILKITTVFYADVVFEKIPNHVLDKVYIARK